MKPEQVQQLYGPEYASRYNATFLEDPIFKDKTDAEALILGRLFEASGQSPKWLDLACGTGYFLSRFPGLERAGVDLSKDMLDKARDLNPCISLVQGDLRDTSLFRPATWDVISCMWWSYQYLETIEEIELFIKNARHWLAPDGYLFLPIAALSLIHNGGNDSPGHDLPYPVFANLPVLGGELAITAIHWSWKEPNGYMHENLLAPHPEAMKSIASKHFQHVTIVTYHHSGYMGLICGDRDVNALRIQDLFPEVPSYRRNPPLT